LVLKEDATNADAGALLSADALSNGELRRLTILCCDLVGSTELSERHDPERYRALVRQYQLLARDTIQQRYDGHIVSVKGDGFLAVFGYPHAHEDDTGRAVQAGLDLCHAMARISERAQRELGESLDLRVGVHRGLVYIDTDEDDVYGLAANLASRVEGLAVPGTVVITDEVRRLVEDRLEVTAGPPQTVKGVTEPIVPFTVVAGSFERVARRARTPLVGREPDLEHLRATWSDALSGRATRSPAIAIRGEAGIGKSRLALAVADDVRSSGSPVIELAGSQLHMGAGFHPLRVLIESRCAIDADMDAAERLRRLSAEAVSIGIDPKSAVPLLAPILGLAPGAGYEPVHAEGRKLFEEITAAACDYVLCCFGGAPGLLLVEDVQWLDASTVALLSELLVRGPSTLCIVLTSRGVLPVAVEHTIELEALSRDLCRRLIEELYPDGLPDGATASIIERSDGVPLYVEELARDVENPAPARRSVEHAEGVPDPLYEPLVAQLLSTTGGVAVAGAAATIGGVIDLALLRALVDLPDDALQLELDALTERAILVASEQGGLGLRFRHELLRVVAYDVQPPATRRQVHGRIADMLLLRVGDDDVVDWNLAAIHYERASRPEEAATAHANAADVARRRGALTEARDELGRSIELLVSLPEDRERTAREVSLRLRRGFLAMSAEGAGSSDAASDYERCLELAMADAQGDEMFSSLISLWAYHVSRSELDRARDVLEALRRSLYGPREWFRPANTAGFGMIEWFEGSFAAAFETLQSSADALGDDEENVDDVWFVPNDPTASIHTHLALAAFMCGDIVAADEAMTRSFARSATLAFPQGPWSTAYGRWLRSWMLTEQGRFDDAAADAGTLLDLGSRHGFDSWVMIAMTQMAAIDATRAVRADDADAAAGHASALSGLVGMWQALELRVFLPYYLTVLGSVSATAGDRDAALEHYAAAGALADATNMRFYAAETARRGALTAADRDERERRLGNALELARSQRAQPFVLRIALDLHDLDPHRAARVLEVAVGAFPPGASSSDVDDARARLSARL
jgi:class 3 adenylate cyclase/tetratricopeptide (TPR) repeat protein